MLLENGTYKAVVAKVHLYERGELKRLTAAFLLEVDGKEITHREWLELNDGTISEKTLARLRRCFPKWDGTIEKLEEGFCVRDTEVEIVVENQEDEKEPGKWWTKILFMNPPGGKGATIPEKMDRGTLVSKYASRFRALAGGTKTVEIRKSPAFMPPTHKQEKPPEPAQSPAREATMEECWAAHCQRHDGQPREEVEADWFSLLKHIMPGKESGDFTPQEWGQVLERIMDDLPV